jgi:hypothetical protein
VQGLVAAVGKLDAHAGTVPGSASDRFAVAVRIATVAADHLVAGHRTLQSSREGSSRVTVSANASAAPATRTVASV